MRLGLLTGGGDCPGLNAVIRAVVRRSDDYGSACIGFRDGFRGLLTGEHMLLEPNERIDRIVRRGGTILGTARVNPQVLRDGLPTIMKTLKDNKIDALVPIGGEGTLTAGAWLYQEGVPVVGVPKTIDNDIDKTDVTFGFDTAVTVATEAIDRLHTTAESHQRVMLVEVMGRHAGWIALHSGLAGGAHLTLIPEVPFDVQDVCDRIEARFARGDKFFICVVAEGAAPLPGSMDFREGGIDEFGHRIFAGVAHQLGEEIERRLDYEVRSTVLGYTQRGGTPTGYDRVLATRFGLRAADAVQSGDFGNMVALHGSDIDLVPLTDATAELKTVPRSQYEEALSLFK